MFKVLIADDEPKIRNGMLNAFNWNELGLTVVGIAKNGLEAMEIVEKNSPDICLIDICMPFVNGLEIIERIMNINPFCINIIISGHDEFEYAQKAVKLKAYDYILKPINEDELLNVIKRAKQDLENILDREKRYKTANVMLEKNMPVLQHEFINQWLKGLMSKEEIEENIAFHNLNMNGELGLVLIKTYAGLLNGKSKFEGERQLLLFAIQNVMEELLESFKPFVTIRDGNENLVSIVTIKNQKDWTEIKCLIEGNIEKYLSYKVALFQKVIKNGLEGIPSAYEGIYKEMHNEALYLPIIKRIKSYIEKNYMDSQLRLQHLVEENQMSLSYLSKLFKQETGESFIDYLIRFRINKSISLLNDPMLKIYEIAELVGYSSQHYYCEAFKKVLGVSPTEFRKKETDNT